MLLYPICYISYKGEQKKNKLFCDTKNLMSDKMVFMYGSCGRIGNKTE